ncbi:MAG TPA: nucleotide disphospho-sugar-binding domain-containing protein, partial [Patescibacteria group bacterium]|nr:nucleotide disphospho-sugar-binding domain-containing protein [Patescibacteria group bacterium]
NFIQKFPTGKKIIYISYGTFINDDLSFYAMCIEAFRGSEYQVIISLGNRHDPTIFSNVPQNIIIKKYVNQLEILKRTSLFISHGGMNGVSESLYYGVPMLLIPETEEQRFNALRVQQTGAGIVLKKRGLTSDIIHDMTEKLLYDPKFVKNAKKQQELFRKSGGYKKAADEIEGCLNKATLVQ